MKIILTNIFLAFSIIACAQSNFYKLSIGGGAGFTRSFTDLPEHNYGQAFYGTADFFFTPFTSLGLEFQDGHVKGGQNNMDGRGSSFDNSYRSASVAGKLYLGAVVDYKHSKLFDYLKGLYVGAGVGAIQNRLFDLQRTDSDEPEQVYRQFSKEAFIPLNLGLNYYIHDKYGQYRYVLNVNYQGNITLGEGLDSYDYSTVEFKNSNPDVFTYLTLGVKYKFGPIGITPKTFKRY